MDIFQVIGIGMVATVLSLLIKQQRPELALAIPILAAITILMLAAPYLRSVVSMFEDIADRVGIEAQYLQIVLKIIGVAYVCQFASDLCKDAGEAAMSGKIELAGKIMMITMSMPIIYRLLGLVSSIINF